MFKKELGNLPGGVYLPPPLRRLPDTVAGTPLYDTGTHRAPIYDVSGAPGTPQGTLGTPKGPPRSPKDPPTDPQGRPNDA